MGTAGFRRYMWRRILQGQRELKFYLRFQALGNLRNRDLFARVQGARTGLRIL